MRIRVPRSAGVDPRCTGVTTRTEVCRMLHGLDTSLRGGGLFIPFGGPKAHGAFGMTALAGPFPQSAQGHNRQVSDSYWTTVLA